MADRGEMFLAAAVRPFTLGMQAGELLISLSSSPHLTSPLTIRLSVSITEGWLMAWLNPHTSRHVLGAPISWGQDLEP